MHTHVHTYVSHQPNLLSMPFQCVARTWSRTKERRGLKKSFAEKAEKKENNILSGWVVKV